MESPPDSTAKAAQEAFQKFSTEAWTLLAVGLSVILLRTYSRLRSVGFKGLRPDDFLVWLAGVRSTTRKAAGTPLIDKPSIQRSYTLEKLASHILLGSTPVDLQTTA